MLNALLFKEEAGLRWRDMPRNMPGWEVVVRYVRDWQSQGEWSELGEAIGRLRGDPSSRAVFGAHRNRVISAAKIVQSPMQAPEKKGPHAASQASSSCLFIRAPDNKKARR